MSWLSLGLGLAVSISQFWIVYRIVRKKDFAGLARIRVCCNSIFSLGVYTLQLRNKYVLALARVRVSSQYFPVLGCLSYSCARKSWSVLDHGRRGRVPAAVVEWLARRTP